MTAPIPVTIRPPVAADRAALNSAIRRSRALHGRWCDHERWALLAEDF